MQILRMFQMTAHRKRLLVFFICLLMLGITADVIGPLVFRALIDGWTAIASGKPIDLGPIADYARWIFPSTNSQDLSERNHSTIWFLLGIYFISLALGFISSFSWGFGDYWRTIEYCELKHEISKKLQTLHMAYFEQDNAGTIHARLGKAVSDTMRCVYECYAFVLPKMPSFIAILALFIVYAGPLATLITLLPVVLVFSLAFLSSRAIKQYIDNERDIDEENEKLMYQVISGIRTILSFGMEPYMDRRISETKQRFIDNSYWLEIVWNKYARARELVMKCVHGGLIIFCNNAVFNDQLSTGTVVMLISYCDRIYQPLWQICYIVCDRMFRQYSKIERLYQVMDTKPKVADCDSPVILPQIEGRIDFQDVAFSYSKDRFREELQQIYGEVQKMLPLKARIRRGKLGEKECTILKNQRLLQITRYKRIKEDMKNGVLDRFSLSISPSEIVAIVGPTGSGKSTIIKLLQRYYDVAQGSIRIDGVDIRNISLRQLRKTAAEVTQETDLFDDSLRINITCGHEVPEDMLRWATEQASLDDFIKSLPLGYDTLVGDRGIKLSGGQKQRVIIARAFLKVRLFDCRIVILDEPTASLDSKTEESIQRSLAKLVCGRTTIMIAHRLSTIKAAHRIICIDKGRIVEIGDHDQLLKNQGPYAHLWKIQTEGFSNALNELCSGHRPKGGVS